jgi:hypothetical protein
MLNNLEIFFRDFTKKIEFIMYLFIVIKITFFNKIIFYFVWIQQIKVIFLIIK